MPPTMVLFLAALKGLTDPEDKRKAIGAQFIRTFEKMIRNLIREHYKNREELRLSVPKFQLLTAAIARRDAYEADMCMLSILGRASDYLGPYLEEKQK